MLRKRGRGEGTLWENIACRLEGSLVVLEPLERRHEQGLFEAARDPRIWR